MELIQFAIQNAADLFLLIDETGRILDVNEAVCRRLGYSRSQLLQMTAWQIDPRQSPRRWAAYWSDLKQRRQIRLESSLRTQSGEEFPVEFTANRVVHMGRAYNCTLIRDITERKKSDEEIRRSNQLIRAIIDAFPGLISSKDAELRYLLINKQQAQLYGTTVEGAVGKRAGELINEEYGTHSQSADRRVLTAGEMVQYEDETPDAFGNLHHWLTTKVPLRGSASADSDQPAPIQGVVTVCVDISELKRAQKALQESEERFRELAERIEECFWMSDARTDSLLYASPAYEKIYGRPSFPGFEAFTQEVHPDDREQFVREVADNRRRGGGIIQFRYVRPDGSIRWIRDRSFEVRDKQGNLLRFVGAAEDITERKTAQEQVQRQRHQLEQILDAVQAQVWYLDTDARVVLLNRFAQQSKALPASEMIGKPIFDLGAVEDNAGELYSRSLEIIRVGKPLLGAIQLFSLGKEKYWGSIDQVPTFDAQGLINGLLVFVYDITNLKRTENALRESEAQLRHAACVARSLVRVRSCGHLFALCGPESARPSGSARADARVEHCCALSAGSGRDRAPDSQHSDRFR